MQGCLVYVDMEVPNLVDALYCESNSLTLIISGRLTAVCTQIGLVVM
jgi:hypothetical protein